ncbi:hypothetical protein NEOLEDRAFT_1180593 [Neolentinus lepideus HHB14362 ss-1]|uniref:F-box domain-containing protein n=1 Tax=Neolentinus lepideus HHB14362 ss-1 TaxID=1314782 RepID=A0A165QT70_9AGAM|nr:hypothetical protein NEOLEDRAFT_1180593 [Neolentinus lepideus HHB14362 ss-1]
MPNTKLDTAASYPGRLCSRIPVELYRFLAECLAAPVPHQPTLARLCRVNKAFRAEAERVLYRTVRCLSAESMSTFCRTMTGTSKERLCVKVESIHITTTAKLRSAQGLDKIQGTLQCLSGLKEVTWDDTEFHHLDYAQNLPGPLHVLAECAKLDLHRLTCNFLVDRRIFTFLESQPNLKDFRCRSYHQWNTYEQVDVPESFLSHLHTLHAPASFVTMLRGATLNISTLDLNASLDNDIEERALLNMLGALSPSLVTLRLYGNWQSSMLQIMEIIAERVVGLKMWVFQGQDTVRPYSCRPDCLSPGAPTLQPKPKISEVWGIAMRFRSLETLVIPPFTWSPAFCMHVTDGLVHACPTLVRVVYYDGSKRPWTFVRSEPGSRLKISEEEDFSLNPSIFDSPVSAG